MTLLLALSSLLSRFLGVYRNYALATLFGASELSDAYFAAFQIPDTIYRLLVFGAISASFVPLFLQLKKHSREEAWEFVNTTLNGFLALIFIISGLSFFFSKSLVSIVYPDFGPELQETTHQLLRIMLISPIFFSLSSIFAGIQNAFRNFWGFALAPLVYNCGIIFGILYLSPNYGIYGVAYGVVIGAFLHSLVQLIPSFYLGFRWRPRFTWSEPLKKLVITGIPRIMSMASFQLNFFIEGIVASTLIVGNLTVLRYAQDIQSFPIGIIGVSVAIASFAILSQYVIDDEHAKLAHYIEHKLDQLLLLMIPAAFGLYVLREHIIELVLAGGVFGVDQVQLTAQVLSYLCFGLIGASIAPILSRVFFAYHDTIRPFFISFFTIILNTVLAMYLAKTMGVAGIGLSNAITATFSALALIIVLNWKYLPHQRLVNIPRLVLYMGASGLMAWIVNWSAGMLPVPDGKIELGLSIVALTSIGVLSYGLILLVVLRRDLFQMLRTVRQREIIARDE
ncbi:MAG: murein biosynthesis integral membrane protein MurJ [Candidatus Gracilibacteria bacterium]|nr:murein biosynthesis integral membrane protein MurJ [Candidatus Gracilibacteria bacterium]